MDQFNEREQSFAGKTASQWTDDSLERLDAANVADQAPLESIINTYQSATTPKELESAVRNFQTQLKLAQGNAAKTAPKIPEIVGGDRTPGMVGNLIQNINELVPEVQRNAAKYPNVVSELKTIGNLIKHYSAHGGINESMVKAALAYFSQNLRRKVRVNPDAGSNYVIDAKPAKDWEEYWSKLFADKSSPVISDEDSQKLADCLDAFGDFFVIDPEYDPDLASPSDHAMRESIRQHLRNVMFG